MQPLAEQLQHGLDTLAIKLAPAQQQQLLLFIELLLKWNKVYNLTAIRNPHEMVTLHLLDSLSVLPLLQQHSPVKRILDVGTGGGIPGIPLAICMPETEFVLMDARAKKIHFLQTVKTLIKLENVKAVHSRVEKYQDRRQFDQVISRAFASLTDMLTGCAHLCQPQGRFMAMKGQFPEEEIAQLPKGFKIDSINQICVPGLDAQRHLLEISFD